LKTGMLFFMPAPSVLWTNANLITVTGNGSPYGLIEDGAIATEGNRISWIGRSRDVPVQDYIQEHDCGGRFVSPGLIDCHTHLLYGGDRIDEFEARCKGADYREIAAAGGGIMATVRRTRETGREQLIDQAAARLRHFLAEGVTTTEIKSGYGLDTETELKMLDSIRGLREESPAGIRATFLGAHTVPDEFRGKADEYINLVCEEMIPAVARHELATAVDAFCETIAFKPEQIARVFTSARAHHLQIKLHADQLSDSGGAALAARFSALSADHLEYAVESGIAAMAAAGTVAVLLPGAFYVLGESRLPPVELFRKHGVPMAVASDSNPGSSPVLSLRLMMNMACTLFKLTPEETITAVTRHAAAALGMGHETGTLETGKLADLAVWDINHPAELAYYAGGNLCYKSYRGGQEIRP